MRESPQSGERNSQTTGETTGLGTGLILGIESSCDETAAAVVRAGSEALSNVVASQMSLHANYGGVVPELASREHLRNIVPVVREAMSRASAVAGHPITFADLDAVAITAGPGLAGALLVGITYAKALTFGLDKPLISVNHLEGHIHAVLMETRQRSELPMELPLLALVVSGGHTHLYLATHEQGSETIWTYRNVGRTVDDAAGEAYDKVAKLLGLGYPGGPWIDALAPHGNPRAVPFIFAEIKHRAPRPGVTNKKAPANTAGPHFDFSFSGIKTAVLRYVETHHMRDSIEARRIALAADPTLTPKSAAAVKLCDQQTLDLIASFQYAVVGNLQRQTFAAAAALGAHSIVVSGGVAANSELRRRLQAEADRRNLTIAFPSLALSTDNAAMIAAAAWPKLLARDFASEDLGAAPQLRLGQQ
ncbi:tRNA (adenosine(37)-N6)-threonylcarbamoyltransferase complex transferase subunit TsaD [Tunturibacter empetritectus]|uniref:tRNA N6-adenosine threonylcarbamoyltransferase n=1 Tax=Tunturiibacter lichenicola TaxID=2051959 RepID=A0A7W8J914_9BACT|nr:tRNA (adenosine(37)-N6)-threonylcarbamoyltransferase complex transferase subunit TsaD [Edaphobacter lichenicola]MBB5343544.1 N6-L-threonylcarbamoyladenine synthase [Edaphobacter lichenicola]